jgi:hypothetical protein
LRVPADGNAPEGMETIAELCHVGRDLSIRCCEYTEKLFANSTKTYALLGYGYYTHFVLRTFHALSERVQSCFART